MDGLPKGQSTRDWLEDLRPLVLILGQRPTELPRLGMEVRKAATYLMGLNMAFPKSENLRTSLRWTPLGFTTVRGQG